MDQIVPVVLIAYGVGFLVAMICIYMVESINYKYHDVHAVRPYAPQIHLFILFCWPLALIIAIGFGGMKFICSLTRGFLK